MEWGDVPTWVGAVTSTAALTAAVVAAFAARRILGIEIGRDEGQAHERRSRQAELVAAWLTDRASRDRPAPATRWVCLLRNVSAVPVYDVLLTYQVGDTRHVDEVFPQMPPGDHERDVVDAAAFALAHGTDDVELTMSFTDAAGRRWTRNRVGLQIQPPAI